MTTTSAPSLAATMRDTLAEIVDALVEVDATIAGLMAVRTRLLDDVRTWSELTEAADEHPTPASRELALRSVRAEVACALRLPERTVERLFGEARMLLRDLPGTMAALGAGEVTYRHAQVVVEHGAGLEPSALETFERLALPFARSSTAASFDRSARRLRESLSPESLEQRTAAAVERREALLLPARDGMADLLLHLPAHEARAIWTRATECASRLRRDGDARTLTQLRVDVMRDAPLTDPPGSPRRVRPDVYVTVPVLSLMGLSAEPASLEGHGPIAVSTARELAADAPSLVRLLTHPETGTVLSVGRERYAVPADLRTALRVRHGTCGFPGCARDASSCDIDPTVDWARDGTTSIDNLAFLCRGHHTLKHHAGWRLVQGDGGVLRWRSPAGREYVREPVSNSP